MKKPEIPEDEDIRLKSLRSLNILDTPPEERFDRLVSMACSMFDVPSAFISLIDADRQWFKASIGIDFDQIPRENAICGHAILKDETLIIHDAAADNRFADGPMVMGDTNARFYASCPLSLENGCRVGTLCIIDDHPRIFDDKAFILLRDLATTVEREFKIMQTEITDELTGIYNRQGFLLATRHSLNLCIRQDLPAILAYIHLDDLKSFYEDFGHKEGARVPTEFANLLINECRPSDIFARLGIDEFVALFINAPYDAAEGIMTRICRALGKLARSNESGHNYSFRYGLVEYDFRHHKQIKTLIDDGAAAMRDSLRTEQKRKKLPLADARTGIAKPQDVDRDKENASA